MADDDDLGFDARISKTGVVTVFRQHRPVTTLRGLAARELIARLEHASPAQRQQHLARVTGNYKRGNERTALQASLRKR